MDGIIFYWLVWFFWVIATFFIHDRKKRSYLSIWLLVAIILSLQTLTIGHVEISLLTVWILLTTYLLIAVKKRKAAVYLLLTIFIMMLSVATFQLLALLDPIWLLFDAVWLQALLLTYLALVLHKSTYMRLITVLSGGAHGDILYSLIVRKLTQTYPIGSLAMLDVLALSSAFLLIIGGFKQISLFFEENFEARIRNDQKISRKDS